MCSKILVTVLKARSTAYVFLVTFLTPTKNLAVSEKIGKTANPRPR